MVENPSSAPDFVTSPKLEEGIKNGRITTFTITQQYLPYYQKAASKTNFEVAVIAKPGQHYITSKIDSVGRFRFKTPTLIVGKSQDPVREGSVAISLKRPEGVKYDTAFNAERQRIQPR